MNWKNLQEWERGALIGFTLWISLLILVFFKYFYSRFFVESLGSQVKPFLYFTFPNLLLLSLYGILLTGCGTLIGYLIKKKY